MGSLYRSRHGVEESWVIEGDEEYEPSEGDVNNWEDDASNGAEEVGGREAALKMDEAKGVTTYSATRPRRSPRQGLHSSAIEPKLVYPSMRQNLRKSWAGERNGSATLSSGSHLTSHTRMRSSAAGSHSSSHTPARPRQRAVQEETYSEKDVSRTYDARSNKPSKKSDSGNVWDSLLWPIAKFAFSILTGAVQTLKTPLSYALAIWMLFGMMVVVRNLVTSSVYSALSPICRIPGTSYLNLPFCSTAEPVAPVEFDQLMTVQSALEDVLATAAGEATLPLDMKRSEASIRDLKHVVKFSTLPSRNELVFEFTGFIETARQASGDLTRFNSRIDRALDHVLSINRWTLQVIDGISQQEALRGSVNTFFADKILAPFQPVRLTERMLLDQYLRHTTAVEDHIAELIVEAQALLAILQNLDDRLDIIADIATRDGLSTKGSRDELLETLWTKLGGNRSSVNKLNEQLQLLKHVGHYRRMAWAHVSGTVLKLQAIAAGLEDLRERVAAPEVVGVRDGVPLKLHIDNIQLGIERLEAQRQETRRMKGEMHQRVLGRGDVAEGRMIDGARTVTVAAG